MKKLRLMLVDDQSLFREALRTLLGLQPDFEIVAEAENGERAVALAQTHGPDVILMDLRMPIMGGVEATRDLRGDARRRGGLPAESLLGGKTLRVGACRRPGHLRARALGGRAHDGGAEPTDRKRGPPTGTAAR